MRLQQEDSSAFNTNFKSGKFSHSAKTLTQDVVVTQNGSIVNAFDPNGGTYNVILPPYEAGRFYVVAHTGTSGTLNVLDANSGPVTTLGPKDSTLLFAGNGIWTGVVGGFALDIYGYTGPGHKEGLVPDPGPGPAPSPPRFLSENAGWATVAGLAASNSYFFNMKGGAVTLVPSGSETLEFLSANTAITILAQSGTSPKSIRFTLNASNIDHNALLNYSADQHVAHSSVTLTAGLGISGGGTIAASRTFDFSPNELTIATPALTDYAVWDLAAGGPRRGLLSAINGILDHNAMLNYSADRHVAHSAVSIVAGVGMAGGGDITASRVLSMDYTTLSLDVPTPGDYLAFFDVSAGDHNRALVSSFNGIMDHNALINYVPTQHVDHTLVSVVAGSGLTGGGTIAATRTLGLDNPVDGTTYGRKGTSWQALANITVGTTAPSSPAVNDVWIDTN